MIRTVARRLARLEERAAVTSKQWIHTVRVLLVNPEKGCTGVIVVETGKPITRVDPTPEEVAPSGVCSPGSDLSRRPALTRNVSRRLERLEAARGFTVSAEDWRTLQIGEIIWERKRRRLEAEGKACDRPPFNPTHGPFKMLSLEETLHKRRQERVDRRQREQETGANGT